MVVPCDEITLQDIDELDRGVSSLERDICSALSNGGVNDSSFYKEYGALNKKYKEIQAYLNMRRICSSEEYHVGSRLRNLKVTLLGNLNL